MSAYFESLNRRSRPASSAKVATAVAPQVPTPVVAPIAAPAPAVTRPVRPVERSVARGTLPTMGARYNALRERLLVAANGHPLRAIVFAGCEGGEGSGEIVREFAETLATSGLNILVLDAGMGRDASPGTADVAELVARDGSAAGTSWGRGRLTTVSGPSGNADKEHFYRSAEFASWLDRQRGLYDYLLLDAPPIVRFADGMLLGRLCDGVVLVVESGTTHRDAFVRAREQLDRSGVKVIGAVLNRVRDELPAVLRPYFPGE